jgi:hypothetical protein
LFEKNGSSFREDLPHVPIWDLVAHQGLQLLNLAVEFAVCGEADQIAVFSERFWWPSG